MSVETTRTRVTEYLCIGCPLGCRLEVEDDGKRILEVRGFRCRIGKEFAVQEHTAPMRLLTTTVRIRTGQWARLPVKTTCPIPKERVGQLAQLLRRIEVEAPVHAGDVIVSDALGLGIDVIATRTVRRAEEGGRNACA